MSLSQKQQKAVIRRQLEKHRNAGPDEMSSRIVAALEVAEDLDLPDNDGGILETPGATRRDDAPRPAAPGMVIVAGSPEFEKAMLQVRGASRSDAAIASPDSHTVRETVAAMADTILTSPEVEPLERGDAKAGGLDRWWELPDLIKALEDALPAAYQFPVEKEGRKISVTLTRKVDCSVASGNVKVTFAHPGVTGDSSLAKVDSAGNWEGDNTFHLDLPATDTVSIYDQRVNVSQIMRNIDKSARSLYRPRGEVVSQTPIVKGSLTFDPFRSVGVREEGGAEISAEDTDRLRKLGLL